MTEQAASTRGGPSAPGAPPSVGRSSDASAHPPSVRAPGGTTIAAPRQPHAHRAPKARPVACEARAIDCANGGGARRATGRRSRPAGARLRWVPGCVVHGAVAPRLAADRGPARAAPVGGCGATDQAGVIRPAQLRRLHATTRPGRGVCCDRCRVDRRCARHRAVRRDGRIRRWSACPRMCRPAPGSGDGRGVSGEHRSADRRLRLVRRHGIRRCAACRDGGPRGAGALRGHRRVRSCDLHGRRLGGVVWSLVIPWGPTLSAPGTPARMGSSTTMSPSSRPGVSSCRASTRQCCWCRAARIGWCRPPTPSGCSDTVPAPSHGRARTTAMSRSWRPVPLPWTGCTPTAGRTRSSRNVRPHAVAWSMRHGGSLQLRHRAPTLRGRARSRPVDAAMPRLGQDS